MILSSNFSLPEFASKDMAEFPESVKSNLAQLANNLQVLRNHLEKPIIINSGYRSENYNKSIGGVKNSQHVLGNASDIRVEGISPKVLYGQIKMLIDDGKMKQGGLGLYDTFVHYDIRGRLARWNFSTKYK
jgi:uncharacterized protein YcbK (DUF882 family)